MNFSHTLVRGGIHGQFTQSNLFLCCRQLPRRAAPSPNSSPLGGRRSLQLRRDTGVSDLATAERAATHPLSSQVGRDGSRKSSLPACQQPCQRRQLSLPDCPPSLHLSPHPAPLLLVDRIKSASDMVINA